MATDLVQMRDDVRAWTVRKGWRENPEISERTMGEELALLHTELAEATEAYRVNGLGSWITSHDEIIPILSNDYLGEKPEGVGSELADTLIRLLDNYAQRGLIPKPHPIDDDGQHERFADDISALHALVGDIHIKWYFDQSRLYLQEQYDKVLSVLLYTAEKWKIDIYAEYEMKMEYNETRAHRHGGKRL